MEVHNKIKYLNPNNGIFIPSFGLFSVFLRSVIHGCGPETSGVGERVACWGASVTLRPGVGIGAWPFVFSLS